MVQFIGCLGVAAGIEQSAFGVDDDAIANPYRAIVDRNVFDLKPIPPPVPVQQEKPPAPPPNVKLTGITSIFGKPRALFLVGAVPTGPGKPTGPNSDKSVILTVGERQDSLELLEVDMKEGTAKVKNDGTEVVLTLPSGPTGGGGPPGGPPGVPGMGIPGQPTRLPTFIPQPQAAPSALGAPRPTLPGNAGVNPSVNPYGTADAMNGLSGIPTRDMRTGQIGTVAQDNATLEEKMLMLEANRIAAANAHNGANMALPPLPPPAPGVAELLGQNPSGQTTSPTTPHPNQNPIWSKQNPFLPPPGFPGLPGPK